MKMRLIHHLLVVATFFGVGLAPAVLKADTFDVTTGFSTSNGNPNGAWTYGWMDTGFTTFTAYATVAGTNNDGWTNTAIDSWIWHNDRGSEQYGVPEGWLSLSPGLHSEATVLRWTAPAGVSGLVQVDGQFLGGDTATENLFVFSGAAKTVGDTLWTGTNAGSFSFSTNVNPGDTINFAIQGDYSFGNTPLSATIQTSAVPEPATDTLLMGAAVLVFAFYRRRRRA